MIRNIGQAGAVSPLQEEVRRQGGAVQVPTTSHTTAAVDTLEISSEALRMREGGKSAEAARTRDAADTQRIKDNIASGFYNTPAVQRAVAAKINKSLLD